MVIPPVRSAYREASGRGRSGPREWFVNSEGGLSAAVHWVSIASCRLPTAICFSSSSTNGMDLLQPHQRDIQSCYSHQNSFEANCRPSDETSRSRKRRIS